MKNINGKCVHWLQRCVCVCLCVCEGWGWGGGGWWWWIIGMQQEYICWKRWICQSGWVGVGSWKWWNCRRRENRPQSYCYMVFKSFVCGMNRAFHTTRKNLNYFMRASSLLKYSNIWNNLHCYISLNYPSNRSNTRWDLYNGNVYNEKECQEKKWYTVTNKRLMH